MKEVQHVWAILCYAAMFCVGWNSWDVYLDRGFEAAAMYSFVMMVLVGSVRIVGHFVIEGPKL